MNNFKENSLQIKKYYEKQRNGGKGLSLEKSTLSFHKHTNKKQTASDSILPDEIYLKIFSYLLPPDLITCSNVCKKWNILSEDNIIWQPIAKSFYPNKNFKNVESIKKEILNNHGIFQVSKQDAIKLKQKDRFTFQPVYIKEYLLKSLNLKLAIVLNDRRGRELYPYYISDSCSASAAMSLSFTWNKASTIEFFNKDFAENDLNYKIYALLPIFAAYKDYKHGPYHRILLYSKENKEKNKKICEDVSLTIDLIGANEGLSFYSAEWKQGGGKAFLIAQLSIQKLLKIININIFSSPSKPIPDSSELDPTYGLHDFLFSIEFSNKKISIWKEQFQHINYSPDDTTVKTGYRRFWIIQPEKTSLRYPFKGKLSYPWKNDCFSGIMEDVCLVDILVFDEFLNPFWTYSQINSVDKCVDSVRRMDYDSQQINCILIKNQELEVNFGIVWDERESKNFVFSLYCDFHLNYINQHFHTRYTI